MGTYPPYGDSGGYLGRVAKSAEGLSNRNEVYAQGRAILQGPHRKEEWRKNDRLPCHGEPENCSRAHSTEERQTIRHEHGYEQYASRRADPKESRPYHR